MPEPIPSSVRPTEQLLPLLSVIPERFQSFCRDLVAALPDIVECHQWGVQGDPQGGIDLVATTTSGNTVSHQCRRVQKFGPAKFRTLVQTVSNEASHYYLLLACRATDAVRKEEKKHVRWTVWDVDDISAKVRELQQEVARRIVRNNFGGRCCQDFLGLQPFNAFLLADEFFAPMLDVQKIFNHCFGLVGRAEELQRLQAFVEDKEKLIFVLAGRGGIGKSKVLRVFAQRAEQSHAVYFAQLDVDITTDALGELQVSNAIIVVDDAHRRKDLGLLFAYAARTRTKLVLSTRPQLRDELPSLASRHHIDVHEIIIPDALGPLTRDDMEALAREVLGPELQQFATGLAAVTKDCPLITVVGGRLLRDKRVLPSLLTNDDEFREAALAKFFDEIVENARPGSEEDAVRKLLEVIAALAPVNPASRRFVSALGVVTAMDHETATAWCERFERHGVFARRHEGLRIVPDLLSDYVLGVACERPAVNGQTFVERVVTAVGGFDSALLRNLAAVDWRVGRKTGEELQVLGKVWQSVIAAFKAAPNSERRVMLRDLKEVGYFIPKQMLQLAKLAFDFPATAGEVGPFAAMMSTTHEDVIADLPETVGYTTHDPSTFDSACDFLWRLANDTRIGEPRLGLGEKGALSILQEIMAPGLRKPPGVHRKLMERVEAWQKVAQTPAEWIGIVRIVEVLFPKTLEDTSDDDMTITIRWFAIPARFLRDLRDRAIAITIAALENADRAVVGAAVKALKKAVEPPESLGGLTITDGIRAEWRPERIAALQHLECLAKRTEDPVIGVQIREAVEWYADKESGEEDVRVVAQQVLAAIPDNLPNRVARFVKNPWGALRRRRDNQKEAARLVEATAREVAAELRPPAAVLLLDDIVSGLAALGLYPSPGHLLSVITRAKPDFAVSMCQTIFAADALALARYVDSLLMPLRQLDEKRFHYLITDAVRQGACRSLESVVSAYALWVGEGGFSESDFESVQLLFAMGGDIATAGINMLPKIAKERPRLAADLLLAIDLAGEQARAESMAAAFDDPEETLFSLLDNRELGACVMKLVDLPQLDGTHLGEFMEECGTRVPLAVIELLAQRIENEDGDGLRYASLPMDLPTLVLSEEDAVSEAYKSLLRRIEEDYLSGRRYDAQRLLALVAADMNTTAVAFLRAASARRTESALSFVAICLRGEACRRLILSDATFAEQLLGDAAAVSHDRYRDVEGALFSCLVPRMTTELLRQDLLMLATAARDGLPIGSRARDLYDRAVNEIQRIERAADVPDEFGVDVE